MIVTMDINWELVLNFLKLVCVWVCLIVFVYYIFMFIFDRVYVFYVLNHIKNRISFYRSARKWRKSINDIVEQEDILDSYASYIVENLGSDEDEYSLRKFFTPVHDRQQLETKIVINITVDSKNPSVRKAMVKIPHHCVKAFDIASYHNITHNGRKLAVQEVKKRRHLLRKDFKWVSPKANVVSVSNRENDNKFWNMDHCSEYLLIDGGNQIMEMFDKRLELSIILKQADNSGIERMVLTCSSFKQIKQAVKLCEKYPGYMYFTAGVHPSNADQWQDHSEEVLEKYAGHPQCVAIGECGIEFPGIDTKKQIEVFTKQIELACKLQKPLWFCSIGADYTLIQVIEKYKGQLKAMCVGEYQPSNVKVFPKTIPALWELLHMGSYISVSSISKEAGGYEKTWFRDWLKKGYISPHKVILASNAPYTGETDDFHKELNREPENLPIILKSVASYMDCPPEKLASAAYQNAQQFFNFS